MPIGAGSLHLCSGSGQKKVSKLRKTIQSIAEKAGVSASTVSRVFSGTGKISPETVQRVLQISAEMGYRPRKYVKKDEVQETGNICLLSSRFHNIINNTFYSQIVAGVEAILRAHNYQLIFKMLTGNAQDDLTTIESLVANKEVDGIILVGYEVDLSLIVRAKERGKPLVLVDHDAWEMDIDCVVNDNVVGARRIVNHLIELGHERIAFIGGPLSHVSLDERYIGYKQALKQAGIPKIQKLITFCTPFFGVDDGHRATTEMLRTVKEPPTAIFAASDALAFGVIKAIQDHGCCVPEDISVVGFDDEEMSRHFTVPLTTVRVHKQEMGIEAGKRLIEIIKGEVTKPVKIVLSTEVVVRKSTAEPPKARRVC